MTAERIVKVSFAVSVVAALIFGASLVGFLLEREIPFDTDEADHALPALNVRTAILRGDVPLLYRSIVDQAFYPPLHSLITALSFLVFGPTFAASRFPSIISYLVAAGSVAVGVRRILLIDGRVRTWCGVSGAMCAFLLGVTSLEAIENSILCMLEPFGTALCGLLLVSATTPRSDVDPSPLLFGTCLALITLTKYNFGIIAFPAVAGALFLQTLPNGLKPSFLRAATLCLLLGVVIGLWLLLTDAYSAMRFITSHPSSGPIFGKENLLFYLRAWRRGYFIAPAVSIAVVPLVVVGAYALWERFAIKLAVFLLLTAGGVGILSTTNETRHLLFVLPAVWVLTGCGAGILLERLSLIARRELRVALVVPAVLGLFGVLSAARLPSLRAELRRSLEVDPGFAELHAFIAREVDPRKPIIGNGFTDQFGPQAVRFVLGRDHGLVAHELQLEVYPFRPENFERARDRKRHIDRPFRDPDFPRAPLRDIVTLGYYRYAVQLQNATHPNSARADAVEFRETLASFPSTTKRVRGWRVVIWRLPEAKDEARRNGRVGKCGKSDRGWGGLPPLRLRETALLELTLRHAHPRSADRFPSLRFPLRIARCLRDASHEKNFFCEPRRRKGGARKLCVSLRFSPGGIFYVATQLGEILPFPERPEVEYPNGGIVEPITDR